MMRIVPLLLSMTAMAQAPTQAEGKGIVEAAIQAVKGTKSPDEIPAAQWGDAITKLKPVAVRNDKLNIAIVLSNKDGVEEGLYVSNPISSYAPSASDGFQVFERLSTDQDKSFGQLYRYRLKAK